MIRYKFERVEPYEIFGWAYDDAPESGAVDVIVSTTHGALKVTADSFREHLKQAGIGDGKAGFSLKLESGERFALDEPVLLNSAVGSLQVRIPDDVVRVLKKDATGDLFLNAPLPLIRCALVLIIKNEAVYVPEWIEYHRAIGVDHFVVFDNGSTDNLKSVLSSYVKLGLVTCIDWPNIQDVAERDRTKGWIEQDTAYAYATRLLAGRASWVGFLDVDEFVVFEDRAVVDIKEFLDEFNAPAVTLFWRMFGTSGLEDRPEGLVVDCYKWRSVDTEARLSKVFAKPDLVHRFVNAHRLVAGSERLVARTLGGESFFGAQRIRASYRSATVHHYHTRSRQEFMEKVKRGWPANDRNKQYNWEQHFKKHDTNEVLDTAAARYVPEVLGRMGKMEALGEEGASLPAPSRWLEVLTNTVLFDYEVRRLEQGRWLLKGYVADLKRPGRHMDVVVHDGYGAVLASDVALRWSPALDIARISDARHGFEVEIVAEGIVYLSSDCFNASVRLAEA